MIKKDIWVSRYLEWSFLKHVHPFLSSLFLFGIPQFSGILILQLNIGNLTSYSFKFFYSVSLASLWIAVGPYLIWVYDKKLLPNFFKKIEELLKSKVEVKKLYNKYKELFTKKFYKATIFWCTILILGYLSGGSYLKLFNIKQGSFIYYLCLYGVAVTGILTSIGFWGVYVTIKAINETSSRIKTINPVHPDGLGGLSPFGYLAIGTTLLVSSGSLYIPLGMDVISKVSDYVFVFYILVLGFISSVAFSFIVPTYIVHKRANSIRCLILGKIGDEYIELLNQKKKDFFNQIKVMNLRNLYLDYKAMHLYPMEIRIVIKLISSILLPIFITLAEYYIFKTR